MKYAQATRAIVRVGEGRGFILQTSDGHRYVITAARCLAPMFPLALPGSSGPRPRLTSVGPLNGDATIPSECRFVDPISDIAILGPPDERDLPDAHAAYSAFVNAHEVLQIAKVPAKEADAKLLSQQGVWFGCKIMSYRGPISIFRAHDGLTKGMAGTPILYDGHAIGVCVGPAEESSDGGFGGPNPRLEDSLPGWLLRGCEYEAGGHD